jgi:hypothetical protein
MNWSVNKLRYCAVVAICAGVSLSAQFAYADGNPLELASSSLSGGTISLATDRLPKGWFSLKNAFAIAKTNLQSTVSFEATRCSAGSDGAAVTVDSASGSASNFTPNKNPKGKTNGYFYSVAIDAAAAIAQYTNHWHRHTKCDGSFTIIGCAADTPVTATITAYGKDGCRTWTDDAGNEQCAAASASFSVSAIHDADTADTCGPGACINACHGACDAQFSCASGHNSCHTAKAKCKAACGKSCK